MRAITLCIPLVLSAAVSVADAQVVPRLPRSRTDSARGRPEPGRLPCTIDCTTLQHESWRQFNYQLDVGLSGGSARIATASNSALSVPRLQGNLGWSRSAWGFMLGGSLDLWRVPSVDGVDGWGTDLMARVARPVFDGGPEVRLGAGVGLDRLEILRPGAFSTDQSHAGLAYEAGLAQELMRDGSIGFLVSAGVVGVQGDPTYPRMPGAMFVAGLTLRWNRWDATRHDTEGGPTRDHPRWPRPTP